MLKMNWKTFIYYTQRHQNDIFSACAIISLTGNLSFVPVTCIILHKMHMKCGIEVARLTAHINVSNASDLYLKQMHVSTHHFIQHWPHITSHCNKPHDKITYKNDNQCIKPFTQTGASETKQYLYEFWVTFKTWPMHQVILLINLWTRCLFLVKFMGWLTLPSEARAVDVQYHYRSHIIIIIVMIMFLVVSTVYIINIAVVTNNRETNEGKWR